MGVALDLVDGVAAKLSETPFGTATVVRALLPEVTKKGLTPTILVALTGKESFELDRANESIKYKVAVGLNFPITNDSQLDEGMDMIEAIQDWISLYSNRKIVTASGTFSLLQPVEMEAPFDSGMVQEASIFFSVINLTYTFYKDRT
tara:strand:+ start:636 stop:1076 length:441 start_codon:yes stop_codon:yes gene_type:complete